jgi:hypothetical protein
LRISELGFEIWDFRLKNSEICDKQSLNFDTNKHNHHDNRKIYTVMPVQARGYGGFILNSRHLWVLLIYQT